MKRTTSAVAVLGLWLSVGIMAAAPVALAKPAASKKVDINVRKGIRGISIGDTPHQVEKEAGKPTRQEPPAQGETMWDYNSIEFAVIFRHGRVFSTITDNPADETSKDVGVGSSLSKLKEAYPNATCTSGTGPGGSPQSETCTLKSGRAVTTFEFATRAAGVEEIAVGRA